jgi:hypothetical protein
VSLSFTGSITSAEPTSVGGGGLSIDSCLAKSVKAAFAMLFRCDAVDVPRYEVRRRSAARRC